MPDVFDFEFLESAFLENLVAENSKVSQSETSNADIFLDVSYPIWRILTFGLFALAHRIYLNQIHVKLNDAKLMGS